MHMWCSGNIRLFQSRANGSIPFMCSYAGRALVVGVPPLYRGCSEFDSRYRLFGSLAQFLEERRFEKPCASVRFRYDPPLVTGQTGKASR